MVEIRRNLVNTIRYNIKCPYEMTPEFIVVHNTANDASAANEVKYMISNNNQVSFHYAVDNVEIVQGIPTNRNTWNAGDGSNGKGNRKGISIEICYSKSGGDKFIQAEKNAAEFIASLLKARGWGIDRVKKHQDFNGKYCPHRTLDMGWDRFLNMIKEHLGTASVETYSYTTFVREVQKATGASVDGIAGKETLSKTVTVSAKKNSRHAVVKPIQQYLYILGYTEVGEADGIAGKKFTAAVKRYQKDNNCVQDGEMTARNKTWKKILKLA